LPAYTRVGSWSVVALAIANDPRLYDAQGFSDRFSLTYAICRDRECAALSSSSAQARLCTFCDCSTSPPTWPMPDSPPRDLGQYVRHLIRDSACQHVFTPIEAAADTLQRDLIPKTSVFGRGPLVFGSGLGSLRPGLPTQYVLTKTVRPGLLRASLCDSRLNWNFAFFLIRALTAESPSRDRRTSIDMQPRSHPTSNSRQPMATGTARLLARARLSGF
jgi:hypothetical protein